MAWANTYDINTPTGEDDPKEGDDRIRETKAALQERIAKDHYFPLTGSEVSDTAAGEHKKVTLRVQDPAPTAAADKGILYSEDVNDKAELFYKDEDGNAIQITSKGAIGIPGEIKMYGGNSAPGGWLLCDGTAVSRTTYAALFAAIGVAFGNGNGTTTFNIPNFTDRFPFGKGAYGIGATGGEATHTLTEAEMPVHSHTTSSSGGHTHTYRDADHFRRVTGGDLVDETNDLAYQVRIKTSDTSSAGDHTHGISNAGSGAAHNNMPPYLIVNYIIKT